MLLRFRSSWVRSKMFPRQSTRNCYVATDKLSNCSNLLQLTPINCSFELKLLNFEFSSSFLIRHKCKHDFDGDYFVRTVGDSKVTRIVVNSSRNMNCTFTITSLRFSFISIKYLFVHCTWVRDKAEHDKNEIYNNDHSNDIWVNKESGWWCVCVCVCVCGGG